MAASLGGILATVLAGAASAAISSAMAPKPVGAQVVAAPTVAAPTVMPTADDASVQAAKKKSIADQIAMQGRASTILTQGNTSTDTLGA